jgi:hypothetical protein
MELKTSQHGETMGKIKKNRARYSLAHCNSLDRTRKRAQRDKAGSIRISDTQRLLSTKNGALKV